MSAISPLQFTAVVIPAFNEAENLAVLIPRVPEKIGHIIVVDNGSNDSTASVARQMGCLVIREARKGYGTAVLSGLAHARLLKAEYAVILDADGANDPESIPELIFPIADNQADLVIAQRTQNVEQGALLPHQIFGNKLAVTLMKLSGANYRDLGPFRSLRLSKLPELDMHDPNFGWNVEMQLKAFQLGLRVKEIDLPYYRRKHGISKISGQVHASVMAGAIILMSIWRYR
ncbi:MAG: glycosyltransferase family 2 protein [Myxococcota bacterium]